MEKVPITFEHEGKQYTGTLDAVHGAGSNNYHLMIDNFYKGRLGEGFSAYRWFLC